MLENELTSIGRNRDAITSFRAERQKYELKFIKRKWTMKALMCRENSRNVSISSVFLNFNGKYVEYSFMLLGLIISSTWKKLF